MVLNAGVQHTVTVRTVLVLLTRTRFHGCLARGGIDCSDVSLPRRVLEAEVLRRDSGYGVVLVCHMGKL